MKRITKSLLWMLLIIAQMFCFWHIDISYGAMNTGDILTNGFADYDPMIVFHTSLYGAIVISIIMAIVYHSECIAESKK